MSTEDNTTSIDAYVTKLSRALRGPRRAKRDLLAEARGALVDAAEAYAARGSDRDDAERQAVTEFGNVDKLARAYQAELGLAQARRTALLVVVTMLAQPILWANASRVMGDVAWPDAVHPAYTVLSNVIEWLGTGTVLAALAARAASGVGVRRIGVRRAVARATGLLALGAAMVFVLLAAALTLVSPNLRELIEAGAPVVLVGFVLVPMTAVAISARACLAAA